MRPWLVCRAAAALLLAFAFSSAANAQPAEKRIALVIGNGAYQAKALATAANDAGLVAQTLQAAGFDVVGARDLDQDALRRAFRDFVEKARSSGPDTVAFVYLSGYGLQVEGENYLVPVDAKIERDADVAAEAVRLSDYFRQLAGLKLKASIVVLDAARRNPFSTAGQPIAGGLALVEPGSGMLVAFNAAPGTIAPEQDGPYGAYAHALAEMMREGGLPLNDLFDRVRLRVNDLTKGAQVPWHASRVEAPFVFFERSPDAPAPVASAEQALAARSRPVREFSPQDAYVAAVQRDTLQGYEEFLEAYPDGPMAKRVRALIAARREAITWRRTHSADTADAYWSYLRRYSRGPHCGDARRRLAQLAAALEPPPSFVAIDYDVPPPPPEETVYIDRPVLAFDDPDFYFAPPPPPPIYFLPPPPPEFVVLAPPPPAVEIFVLPTPVFVPVPVWCRPPTYVVAPPHNVIFNNIHHTVVINNVTNVVTIRNQSGQIVSSAPRSVPGAAGVALGASLPPSLVKRAALIQAQGTGAGVSAPAAGKPPLGQPLPGMSGHPSPVLPGKLPGVPSGAPGAAPSAKNAPIATRGSQPATTGPVPQPGKLPSGNALPGSNGHPLPNAFGKASGAPGGGASAAPAPAGATPRAAPPTATVQKPQPPSPPARALSTVLPNTPSKSQPTWTAPTRLPPAAAQRPSAPPSTLARTPTAPTLPPPSSPAMQAHAYHPQPPVRTPSPPPITQRPASLPMAPHPVPPPAVRPTPAPAYQPPAPPPVIRSAPAAAYHPPAPPVVRSAPAPAYHPPAPPPVVRAAPTPSYHPPPPAVHAAPPPPRAANRAPPPGHRP